MHKLIAFSLSMSVLAALHTTAFAGTLECKFKTKKIEGVESIHIADEALIINSELEIPLEKSRVKCGNFGRQTRYDGSVPGLQVVLKTCTTEAKLHGHLIDSENSIAADVYCNEIL